MEGGKNRLRVVVNGVFFRSGRGGSTMQLMQLKVRDPSLARAPSKTLGGTLQYPRNALKSHS